LTDQIVAMGFGQCHELLARGGLSEPGCAKRDRLGIAANARNTVLATRCAQFSVHCKFAMTGCPQIGQSGKNLHSRELSTCEEFFTDIGIDEERPGGNNSRPSNGSGRLRSLGERKEHPGGHAQTHAAGLRDYRRTLRAHRLRSSDWARRSQKPPPERRSQYCFDRRRRSGC